MCYYTDTQLIDVITSNKAVNAMLYIDLYPIYLIIMIYQAFALKLIIRCYNYDSISIKQIDINSHKKKHPFAHLKYTIMTQTLMRNKHTLVLQM